jgi:hypothetical protein
MKRHERLAKKREKREDKNWRKVLRRMPPRWAMTWRPSDYYDGLTTSPGLKDFHLFPAQARYAEFTQGLLEDWMIPGGSYQRISHIPPSLILRRVK